MAIEITHGGLLTTIQDFGRIGYRAYGVGQGGAMDRMSMVMANLVLDNDLGAPVLEMVHQGPTCRFTGRTLVAISGADMHPVADGQQIPQNCPVIMEAGTILKFSAASKGNYAYMAVAGGFLAEFVLGAYSTHLQGEFGGYKGRALRAGDLLKVKDIKVWPKGSMRSHESVRFARYRLRDCSSLFDTNAVFRVIPGPDFHLFSEQAKRRLFTSKFTVTTQINRIGHRLLGPSLELEHPKEILSQPVIPGAIQVPADGNPIVLMADAQTTGGYPVIGYLSSVELDRFAQAKSGSQIQFERIEIDEASQLLAREQHSFAAWKLKARTAIRYL